MMFREVLNAVLADNMSGRREPVLNDAGWPAVLFTALKSPAWRSCHHRRICFVYIGTSLKSSHAKSFFHFPAKRTFTGKIVLDVLATC